MSDATSDSSFGAVSADLVATAPGLDPHVSELLYRPVAGRPLIMRPLLALSKLQTHVTCKVINPLELSDKLRDLIFAWRQHNGVRLGGMSIGGEHSWAEYILNTGPHQCRIVVDVTYPLLTTSSLRIGLRAAERTGFAIAGEPVKETLKLIDGERVVETLPREHLRRLIPLMFFRGDTWRRMEDELEPILNHLSDVLEGLAPKDDSPLFGGLGVNDLVGILQRARIPLSVFDVDYPTVRVSSEDDLAIVETLLRQRESEASPS